MRRLAALLLLSACSQEPVGTGDETEAGGEPSAAASASANLSGDAAGLEERVDRAMAAVLQDPGGARYRNLRAGLAGTVCGEVDPARKGGGHAGFRPFLVTPEGVGRVAAGPRLTFDDATDPFPDFYIRWCATPEELRRLEPELRAAIARSGGTAPPPAFPEVPAADMPPGDTGEPSAPSATATDGKTGSATPDLDSFSSAVKRKPAPPPPGD